MPEGVGYGPQNTASIGKNLNYIGEHCYAYSGNVTVAQAGETTMLSISTRNEYIVGAFQVSTSEGNGTNTDLQILVNGIMTVAEEFGNTYQLYPASTVPWDIIIPPFTTVELTLSSQSGDVAMQAQFTGKIHGKIE
jgi:hypothetical protein